jgi:hypothetical protein
MVAPLRQELPQYRAVEDMPLDSFLYAESFAGCREPFGDRRLKKRLYSGPRRLWNALSPARTLTRWG